MANTPMHAAVGMTLVKLLPAWLGLPLAFLSHFALDLYPEATGIKPNNAFKKKNLFFTIVQILLVLLVIAVCVVKGSWLYVVAALLANLPDMWDAVNALLKRPKFWYVHDGNFPCKVNGWQEFAMRPWKNAVLDLIFVGFLLLLLMGA